MEQRRAFVTLAEQDGITMRELCRRFGISTKTGYKQLHRYAEEGEAGLADRSRRPLTSPQQTPAARAEIVCALRRHHSTWGPRKLHHRLRALGHDPVPAPSTITAILRREGLLTDDIRPSAQAVRRLPNAWWQMDVMGHTPLQVGRVHPLTIVDDHSRQLLTLLATHTEDLATVQPALIACFRQVGLPWAILADNGAPWGHGGTGTWTRLEAWLLQLGVDVWHGAPYHPQPQGKVERLHRTIAADVFGPHRFVDLSAAQIAFDAFRAVYTHDRPHESLAYAVPASRYRSSPRPYPETLPVIAYADDAQVRIVAPNGTISFAGYRIQVGKAFGRLPVAVVPRATDGHYRVQFCHRHLGTFDLHTLDKEASRCYLCP